MIAKNGDIAYPKTDFVNLDSCLLARPKIASSQAVSRNHVTDLDLRTLEPLQRALLVLDGTVTKFLEAYFLEPVEVLLINQEQQVFTNDHVELEVPSGTDVMIREVILRGRYSAIAYAYATSLLVLSRLPEAMLEQLEVEPSGIGRVLMNSRIESRREILWYRHEEVESLPEEIECLVGSKFLSRAYRIVANSRPIMLINEKFPIYLK